MAKLLKPTGPWNDKLVALDDGHGMQTPGKRTPYIPELGREIRENEFNRKVVGFLADILLSHGFRVLLVAPTDLDTPLSYRTNAANQHKADIYVSVHFNAMSFDFDYSSADGISVHVYLGNMKYESGKLARAVGKYLKQGTRQDWRGYKEDNFHVLRETNMPAILTENGFMDDRREAMLMLNESYQRETAIEHAQGICEYFNIKFKGDSYDPMDKGYLANGDHGESVKNLQKLLNKIGYSLTVDGSYGPATEKAVKGFQKGNNLTVDGYFGPATQSALDEVVARYTVESQEEEKDMPKNVFVVYSAVDAFAVDKAMKRNSGYMVFRHTAEKEEVNAEDTIYIAGGGKEGLKLGKGKVVDLSGDTAEQTAQNVFKRFNLV